MLRIRYGQPVCCDYGVGVERVVNDRPRESVVGNAAAPRGHVVPAVPFVDDGLTRKAKGLRGQVGLFIPFPLRALHRAFMLLAFALWKSKLSIGFFDDADM